MDYHPSTNTWLTIVMRMPTARTLKDHTTAAAKKVIWEVETSVTVRCNDNLSRYANTIILLVRYVIKNRSAQCRHAVTATLRHMKY